MNRQLNSRWIRAARSLFGAVTLFSCVQLRADPGPIREGIDPSAVSYERAMLAYERADYLTAVVQLSQAASLGSARAHEVLGFMYVSGHDLFPGVPRNRRMAVSHFLAASASGSSISAYMLCVLASDLPKRAQARKGCAARLADTAFADASISFERTRPR